MLILARDMRVHDLHLKEDPGPVIQFLSTKTSKSALVASVWTGLHRSYRRYRRKIYSLGDPNVQRTSIAEEGPHQRHQRKI